MTLVAVWDTGEVGVFETEDALVQEVEPPEALRARVFDGRGVEYKISVEPREVGRFDREFVILGGPTGDINPDFVRRSIVDRMEYEPSTELAIAISRFIENHGFGVC